MTNEYYKNMLRDDNYNDLVFTVTFNTGKTKTLRCAYFFDPQPRSDDTIYFLTVDGKKHIYRWSAIISVVRTHQV